MTPKYLSLVTPTKVILSRLVTLSDFTAWYLKVDFGSHGC